MDIRTRKRGLRREFRGRILAMEPYDRRRQEAALVDLFASLPGFADAGLVLLYAKAFPEEIDTRPLIGLALDLGKRLALPRVDKPTKSMTLHAVSDPEADLRPGTLGIPEPAMSCPEVPPERIDWLLAPGLAFDLRGYRLGRGAGHYDRLLARLRPETPAWALALDAQWHEELPVEVHDRPLDGIASPSRIVSLGGDSPEGSERIFR